MISLRRRQLSAWWWRLRPLTLKTLPTSPRCPAPFPRPRLSHPALPAPRVSALVPPSRPLYRPRPLLTSWTTKRQVWDYLLCNQHDHVRLESAEMFKGFISPQVRPQPECKCGLKVHQYKVPWLVAKVSSNSLSYVRDLLLYCSIFCL